MVQGPPGEGLGVVVVENKVKGYLEVREVMACIVIRHMDEAAGGSIQKVREAGEGGGALDRPGMQQARMPIHTTICCQVEHGRPLSASLRCLPDAPPRFASGSGAQGDVLVRIGQDMVGSWPLRRVVHRVGELRAPTGKVRDEPGHSPFRPVLSLARGYKKA